MTDQHNISFFGQKSGIIISTSSKEEPYLYIRCLRKKKNGEWQKFNESKTVKLSILESISILDVLDKKRKIWNTFHSFNEIKTPISFSWDEYDSELLWIKIDDYSRPINYPETELFRKLVLHIVDEKIEFATNNNFKENNKENYEEPSNIIKEKKEYTHQHTKHKSSKTYSKNNNDDATNIKAKIKILREKAILISLQNNEEFWVPRSTILSNFDPDLNEFQDFSIKNWILEKRNIITA